MTSAKKKQFDWIHILQVIPMIRENAIWKANVLSKDSRKPVIGSFWFYGKVNTLSGIFVQDSRQIVLEPQRLANLFPAQWGLMNSHNILAVVLVGM